MLVETPSLKKCGQGTPMFSRRGKSTSVQYLVFNEQENNHESSFAKARRQAQGEARGTLQGPDPLDTIFEQLKNESLVENTQAALTQSQLTKIKQRCSPEFRSVTREENYVYKVLFYIFINLVYQINRPTVALNDGRYNVNFKILDSKDKIVDFNYKPTTVPKKQINQTPYCLQRNLECSFYSRQLWKEKYLKSKQKLNESLQQQKTMQQNQILDLPLALNNSFGVEDIQKNNSSKPSSQKQKRDGRNDSSSSPQRATTKIPPISKGSFYMTERQLSSESIKGVTSHIKSPVSFDKQTKRKPINEGRTLHDERFKTFNKMPLTVSNFKKVVAFNFSTAINKSQFDSGSDNAKKQINASSQIYHPNYNFIYKNLNSGIPDFNRYTDRSFYDQTSKSRVWPSQYDTEKINKAYNLLSLHQKQLEPISFELQSGRDDRLMYSKIEKSEVIPEKVTFEDFLPNSIRSSPMKRAVSQTTKTHKFNLRRLTYQPIQKANGELDIESIERDLYTKTKLL